MIIDVSFERMTRAKGPDRQDYRGAKASNETLRGSRPPLPRFDASGFTDRPKVLLHQISIRLGTKASNTGCLSAHVTCDGAGEGQRLAKAGR